MMKKKWLFWVFCIGELIALTVASFKLFFRPRILFYSGSGVLVSLLFLFALLLLWGIDLFKTPNSLHKIKKAFFVFVFLVGAAASNFLLVHELLRAGVRGSDRWSLYRISDLIGMYQSINDGQLPEKLLDLTSKDLMDGHHISSPNSSFVFLPHTGKKRHPDSKDTETDFHYLYHPTTEKHLASNTVIAHSKPELLHGWMNVLFLDGSIELVKSDSIVISAKEHGWILPTDEALDQAVE